MPTITIIANFYNSGKYIPKLLRSISRQTYTDWELVCVDDCSPGDDSLVVTRMAEKLGISDRVRIIRNATNLGISRAKKVGIDAARGEYITFIDGDDWFAKDALQAMYDAATKTGADVVIASYYRVFAAGFSRRMSLNVPSGDKDRALLRDEFIDKYYSGVCGLNLYGVAYWGKLYRREPLQTLDYDYPPANKINMEDLLFNATLFTTLTTFCFIDTPVYYWRWGGISTHRQNNIFKAVNSIAIYDENYGYRERLCRVAGCPQHNKWLVIELKNVLFTAFTQLLEHQTEAEVRDIIASTYDMSSYGRIVTLPSYNPAYDGNPFVKAYIKHDTERIIHLCHERIRADRWHRLARRLAGLFKI